MVRVSKITNYFLLRNELAAAEEPEIKTHRTDLNNLKMFREGL
jgi:hypothetical protein